MKPPPILERSAEAVRTGAARLARLIGVDHVGFGESRSFDRGGLMKSGGETRCAGEQRKGHFSEHRRTLYCFVCLSRQRPMQRRCTRQLKSKPRSVW